MVYFLLLGLVNALSSSAVFYYCSWVLGSYNDGITQVLFYAIGNLPMGIGVFLCNPLCKRLGRTRAWWRPAPLLRGPGGVPGISHFTAGGFGWPVHQGLGTIPPRTWPVSFSAKP